MQHYIYRNQLAYVAQSEHPNKKSMMGSSAKFGDLARLIAGECSNFREPGAQVHSSAMCANGARKFEGEFDSSSV
jgi:hypothetical protein